MSKIAAPVVVTMKDGGWEPSMMVGKDKVGPVSFEDKRRDCREEGGNVACTVWFICQN